MQGLKVLKHAYKCVSDVKRPSSLGSTPASFRPERRLQQHKRSREARNDDTLIDDLVQPIAHDDMLSRQEGACRAHNSVQVAGVVMQDWYSAVLSIPGHAAKVIV